MLINKLNNRWPRFYAILVFVLATSFTVYEFMLRVMPSAMTHQLMRSFSIDASGLGLMASLFYYGYSPMQIPAGLLYDQIGPRKLLALSTLLCGISGAIFGQADSVYLASFGRFLTGFTASFAFIGALLIASRWFAPKHFALFAGLVQFLGCVGAVIGEAPIASMVNHWGWRHTATGLAAVGLLLSVIMYTFIRDYPNNESVTRPKHLPRISALKGLKRICRSGQTWWVALYAFCCWAPVSIFATLWGPSFLSSAYHLSMTSATGLTSLVWIAIGISSPLAGWWSNYIRGRRRPLITLSIIGLIGSLGMIYLGGLSKWELCGFLILFGLSASSQIVTFGLVLDNNHDTVMGTASGFNNMAVVAGGILLQPLVGVIIHHIWKLHPVFNAGGPIYSLHEYRIALAVIPACFITGLLTSLFAIRETHCIRDHLHHHNSNH